MPQDRYFLDEKFILNSEVTLKEKEFFHLTKVMRKKTEDTIELINGKDQLAQGRILKINSKSAEILVERVDSSVPFNLKIILAQPLLRSNKLDLILEKATELGIDEILFYKAERGEVGLFSQDKQARYHSLMIAALKQCGRLDLPKIHPLPNLSDLKSFDFEFLFGDLTTKNTFNINDFKPKKNICFIIGPESGFSEKEQNFIRASLKATAIKLSPYILRTETASIASAVLLSQIKLKAF